MSTEVENQSRRRLFKKSRGGVELSREETRAVKNGRKALKKQMKQSKTYTKDGFDVVASSAGLYFDTVSKFTFLPLMASGALVPATLAVAASVLTGVYALSYVNEVAENQIVETEVIREVYVEVPVEVEVEVPVEVIEIEYDSANTINISGELVEAGLVISESADFFDTSIFSLFFDSVYDMSCISIVNIPEDVDSSAVEGDNEHLDYPFFAYTFYITNVGASSATYWWDVIKTEETQNVASAAWLMVFEDGEMEFFAEANADGSMACIPASDVDDMGYSTMPLASLAKNADEQYEEVGSYGGRTVYRTLPYAFPSETVMASGTNVIGAGEVIKYTLVLWIEGDDPDATIDLVGATLGIEMQFNASSSVTRVDSATGLEQLETETETQSSMDEIVIG